MAPLHKIDLFELLYIHMWIQELELWGGSVFVEFGLPIFVGEWRERSSYGLPFCYTKPANCQPELLDKAIGHTQIQSIL